LKNRVSFVFIKIVLLFYNQGFEKRKLSPYIEYGKNREPPNPFGIYAKTTLAGTDNISLLNGVVLLHSNLFSWNREAKPYHPDGEDEIRLLSGD
jgi:hypothetical protein